MHPSPARSLPQDMYASLGRRSGGDQAAPPLSFQERLDAANRLAAMLQDAAVRWGLAGRQERGEGRSRRLDARPSGGAAQQAVFARMSGEPATPLGCRNAIVPGTAPALRAQCQVVGAGAAQAIHTCTFAPSFTRPSCSTGPARLRAAELSQWVMSDSDGGASRLPLPQQALVSHPASLRRSSLPLPCLCLPA